MTRIDTFDMTSLLSITHTPGGRKEFKAVFRLSNGKSKTVRFGTSSNYVLNKDKTKADRDAYIKRHSVRERFDEPTTAGSLSRYILWGDSRSFAANTRAFKRRFNL